MSAKAMSTVAGSSNILKRASSTHWILIESPLSHFNLLTIISMHNEQLRLKFTTITIMIGI